MGSQAEARQGQIQIGDGPLAPINGSNEESIRCWSPPGKNVSRAINELTAYTGFVSGFLTSDWTKAEAPQSTSVSSNHDTPP